MEVQFLWTEIHISTPTKVTFVTTRSSGDSFLNRVELQNGCLARGHSNLFVPSTLVDNPYNEDGSFSSEKHKANMSQAIEQYIARVDKTPCMSTVINLYGGVEGNQYLKRREKLLIFLQGSKQKKSELKKNHPTLYQYFSEVWKVRYNHMDRTLPTNYIFMLKCCEMINCLHPICQGTLFQLLTFTVLVLF